MNLYYGLENEDYKYTYGVSQRNVVPFDVDKDIKLTCAKNDWAAAQLLLYCEEEMLVSVDNETCFYKGGPITNIRVDVNIDGIPNEDIEVKLVGLVEDDDRQLKSDQLLDVNYVYVKPKQVQPIWIEVTTKKTTKEGIYKPQISVYGKRMFADEVLLKELTYEVEVVNTVLDDPRDYDFHLDLWQHSSNIARKYDVSLWSEEHFVILDNYIKSLSDLGQKAISVIVSEIPWSGQGEVNNLLNPSNLYEYNMVEVRFTKDQKWEYDYKALNRYIEICLKYGINKEIEVFGLNNIWTNVEAEFGKVIEDYDDAIRIRYYDENENVYKYIKKKADLKQYVQALEHNFIENGWIDLVRILADEPADLDDFKRRVNTIASMAPNFKFKVAINNIEFMGHNIPNVVDYCPNLPCSCSKYNELQEVKKSVDGTITYYVCCGPDYPNTFISSPYVESRIIPWFTWYLDIDGFLRWNYTVWPDDPLTSIRCRGPIWKAGDTNFVYPGRNGKPMLTLRYKLLKKGIRDFEIIKKYTEKYGREEVLDKLKAVFYWDDISQLYKSKKEEMFSGNYMDYDIIINEFLKKLG